MTLTDKMEKLAHSVYCYQAATRFRSDEPCFSLTKAACREYSGIIRGLIEGFYADRGKEGVEPDMLEIFLEEPIDTWRRALKEAKRKEDTP